MTDDDIRYRSVTWLEFYADTRGLGDQDDIRDTLGFYLDKWLEMANSGELSEDDYDKLENAAWERIRQLELRLGL